MVILASKARTISDKNDYNYEILQEEEEEEEEI